MTMFKDNDDVNRKLVKPEFLVKNILGCYFDKKETPIVSEKEVFRDNLIRRAKDKSKNTFYKRFNSDKSMSSTGSPTNNSKDQIVYMVEDGTDLAINKKVKVNVTTYLDKYNF